MCVQVTAGKGTGTLLLRGVATRWSSHVYAMEHALCLRPFLAVALAAPPSDEQWAKMEFAVQLTMPVVDAISSVEMDSATLLTVDDELSRIEHVALDHSNF